MKCAELLFVTRVAEVGGFPGLSLRRPGQTALVSIAPPSLNQACFSFQVLAAMLLTKSELPRALPNEPRIYFVQKHLLPSW